MKQSNKKPPKCRKYINSDSAWTENGILFTMAMDTYKTKQKKNLIVSCDPKGWPYRRMCYVHWLDAVIRNSNSIPRGNDRFPRGFNITCIKMCSLINRRQWRGETHSCSSRILSRQLPKAGWDTCRSGHHTVKINDLTSILKIILGCVMTLRYVLYCDLLCYCRFDYTGYFSWWGKGGAKENCLV